MQNSNKSPLLVIFGATGNLYSDKLAKALYLLFLKGQLPTDFRVFGFARRDLDDKSFRIFTKESILKRGEVDISKIEDFLDHFFYFKGDFSKTDDFIRLKEFLTKSYGAGEERQVLLHIATASQIYEKIFENISLSKLNTINDKVKILIEKPFGKDEPDATRLQTILSKIFKEGQIFQVDHYLAKETAKIVSDFKFDSKEVSKIKVIFHESNVVGSRGASYDAVGAFRDVGQNHMLELLSLAVMNKPSENIRDSRLKVLNDLYIDPNQKIIRAQYEDYLSGPNIATDSQTETFFRVFLRSKNPDLADIAFELEGGKGLVDAKSGITTTTVALEIYFKNKEKIELKIQPVAGTVYESYVAVYNDALKGDQTNFPSIDEIIAEWRITDELLSKWKNIPLVVYKQGSKPEDIN